MIECLIRTIVGIHLEKSRFHVFYLLINMSKRSSNSTLICRVCGDVARGLNFDVMTCMSCKAFFRRNACSTAVRRFPHSDIQISFFFFYLETSSMSIE